MPVHGDTWVGMVAALLDGGRLVERELLDVLTLTAHTLVDGHDGHDGHEDWLPRDVDATVRVRIPPEHPAVPFAITAFLVATGDALEALAERALLERAVASSAHALKAHHETLLDNPQ